jgi:tetratricopeptide (TPR) repeat protein
MRNHSSLPALGCLLLLLAAHTGYAGVPAGAAPAKRPASAARAGAQRGRPPAAPSQRAKPPATLQDLQGTVRLKHGESDWRPARGSEPLVLGDRVQTGVRSSAHIVTSSDRYAMGPETTVTLRTPRRWEIVVGKIIAFLTGGDVHLIAGGMIAAARGTVLQLEVAEDGTTVLTVKEGAVEFSNELGRVTVLASQQSTARPGEAPTRPIVVDATQVMAWEANLQTLLVPTEFVLVSTDPAELEQKLAECRQFVADHPDTAAVHAALAAVLLDLRQTEEALTEAERAVELAPALAQANGVLGYALLQSGRPGEAQEALSRAARSEPEGAQWLIGLGLVALGQPDPKPALDLFTRAEAFAPREAGPPAYLAVAHLRVGDLAAAEAAATRAVALQPDSSLAQASLCYVRLAQGRLDDAREAGEKAVQTAPNSALAHEAYGTALLFLGESQAADEELRYAIETNPLSASAHLARAKLLAQEGELEAALEEGRLAVGLDPTSAPARSTLGLLLLLNRDPVHAGRQFEKALSLNPSLAEAHTGWGQVLMTRGRFQEALEQQKLALALDTNSASVENNLGGVYAARGELGPAREHLQEAIRLQPTWGRPYANLAATYLEENRIREALDAGERAVALGERSAFAHTVLARVYAVQGRTDRALSELREAVAVDDRYPQSHFQLARLYLDQDRSQDAVRELLTWVTVDPSAVLDTRLYARTEATLAWGSDDRRLLEARHSDQADLGRLSYYLSARLDDSDGFRSVNQEESEKFVEGIAGYQPDPTRQFVLLGTLLSRAGGLPGVETPGLAGDPDDWQRFTGHETSLAWRQRLSRAVTGTLKYSYQHSDLDFSNPDSLTGDDRNPFVALDEEVARYSPEVRIDRDLGPRSSLSIGYARRRDRLRDDGLASLFDPDTGETVPTPFAIRGRPSTDTAWLEAAASPSARLLLTAGAHWGRETGCEHTLLPKLAVVYRPDRATWWSLTATPVSRSDALELSPVEALADPKGLSSLSFTAGGHASSYELRWQRQGGRSSTATGSLTYQQVEGLLLDVQDPSLTGLPARVLLDDGHRWVADAAYEQWLTDTVTGRLWARWQSSRGRFPDPAVADAEWPYTPPWQVGARLDFISARGLRAGLEAVEVGRRFDDTRNTRVVDGRLVLNLRIEWQQDLCRTYFLTVSNLADREYDTFAHFPAPGRLFLVGVRWRD